MISRGKDHAALCGVLIALNSLCVAAAQEPGARGTRPFNATQYAGYRIDGISLGGVFRSESIENQEFKCGPSTQFADFIWCQKRSMRPGQGTGSTTSVLHAADGTVAYVNRTIDPAFFGVNAIEGEVKRLSKVFNGEPRIVRMPHREGFPDAVIALWGNVQLADLPEEDLATLSIGGNPRRGFLVDFIGDFKRSAEARLPVYSVAGGAGYVWSASFDDRGRGHLRFFAIDPSATAKPKFVLRSPVCGDPKAQGDFKEHEDRKCRLQQLANSSFKANPKFYDYLVKKTELPGLPSDVPVLRVVFEERIFFGTARWDVLPEADPILELVSEALRKGSGGTALFIAGHTDSRGSETYNFDLSVKRANSVAETLARRNVGTAGIWRVGFGKAIPLRPNNTSENMAVNRRVEFIMASRFDAVVHVITKLGKYMCSENGQEPRPEFCRDTTAVPQTFEAKMVTVPLVTAPAEESKSIPIVVPPPEQFEIELMPPPMVEVGPPLQ